MNLEYDGSNYGVFYGNISLSHIKITLPDCHRKGSLNRAEFTVSLDKNGDLCALNIDKEFSCFKFRCKNRDNKEI